MTTHAHATPQGNEPPATPVPGDFTDATARFRRELLTYCYRMLGSLDEAEDVVQETCPRAWRSYPALEHRSSVRTWLYRIATNACRTACARRRPAGRCRPGFPGRRWPVSATPWRNAGSAEAARGRRMSVDRATWNRSAPPPTNRRRRPQ
ncbi:sigma factor [Streptomyces coelicoflavus]|uniref:sigma factor n=1 Tax=Streptomyces coelicoflavus TaxID=285562 RepID=UPI003A842CC5